MVNVAVLFAPGFEEIEAITPVDVFRRASFDVDMIGDAKEVTGAHDITMRVDRLFDETDFSQYDLIVVPGGLPGSTNLRDDDRVIQLLQQANENEKMLAAICAAPIVLAKAGLLDGKKHTNAPGFEKEIPYGDHQSDAVVVIDGNIATSRGAATALEFSYQLVDQLGGDAESLREAMQYNVLKNYLKENG